MAAILANPRQRTIVAERAGTLAGSVTITDLGGKRAYLSMLAVEPDGQTQGLGRTLIAAAERQAVTVFGTKFMEMTVIGRRAELIAYYERRGYRRTGETRRFPAEVPNRAELTMAVLERQLA